MTVTAAIASGTSGGMRRTMRSIPQQQARRTRTASPDPFPAVAVAVLLRRDTPGQTTRLTSPAAADARGANRARRRRWAGASLTARVDVGTVSALQAGGDLISALEAEPERRQDGDPIQPMPGDPAGRRLQRRQHRDAGRTEDGSER